MVATPTFFEITSKFAGESFGLTIFAQDAAGVALDTTGLVVTFSLSGVADSVGTNLIVASLQDAPSAKFRVEIPAAALVTSPAQRNFYGTIWGKYTGLDPFVIGFTKISLNRYPRLA